MRDLLLRGYSKNQDQYRLADTFKTLKLHDEDFFEVKDEMNIHDPDSFWKACNAIQEQAIREVPTKPEDMMNRAEQIIHESGLDTPTALSDGFDRARNNGCWKEYMGIIHAGYFNIDCRDRTMLWEKTTPDVFTGFESPDLKELLVEVRVDGERLIVNGADLIDTMNDQTLDSRGIRERLAECAEYAWNTEDCIWDAQKPNEPEEDICYKVLAAKTTRACSVVSGICNKKLIK